MNDLDEEFFSISLPEMPPLPPELPAEEVIKKVKELSKWFEPVGSRVTCNPPPMDTDQDYLVLYDKKDCNEINTFLIDQGYYIHDDYFDSDDDDDKALNNSIFNSYKKEDINFIMTSDNEFFD